MALNLQNKYPGRFDPVSADYPQGKFKNRSSPTAQDGSYMERDWLNDWAGFFGALLSNAGITPNGSVDTAQSSQLYSALMTSIYPVGAPIPWPTAVPPTGYLVMNGQSFSTSNYPQLALAYPAGALPDLRGEFIRGWDNGRGIDSGRAVLTVQTDAFQNFTGSFTSRTLSGSSAGAITSGTGSFSFLPKSGISGTSTIATSTGSENLDVTTLNPSLTARTSTETRPRNLSFFYIVRAI